MGKKQGKWSPPADELVESTGEAPMAVSFKPPDGDELVEVKKKDPADLEAGSTERDWVAGGSGSQGQSERSGKPTPKEQYDERIKSLQGLYQSQFQAKFQPRIKEEQSKYEKALAGKQKELQTLVDQQQINVDKANADLKAFSDSLYKETNQRIVDSQSAFEKEFNTENEAMLKTWVDQYGSDFVKEQQEFEKAEFQKNKERNPITTLGKNLWSTMRYQLPADLIGGQIAMERLPESLDKAVFAPIFDPIFKKDAKELPTEIVLSKIQGGDSRMEARRKTILAQALNLKQGGQEYTKNLVNSLDKAEDFLDYMNWAGSAVGQAAGQILPAILTRGGTAFGQEIGTIYLEGVKKIADDNLITPEQVMERGMDDALYPVIFGYAAGKLEMIGAKGVADSFSKKEVMQSMRDRALGFFKKTGLSAAGKESATETGQSFLEQIGATKAAGKTWAESFATIDYNDIKESAAQGFVGGHALALAGKGLRSIADKYIVKAKDDITRKTPQRVIQEQKATISSTSDQTQIEQAAAAIQETADQKPQDEPPASSGGAVVVEKPKSLTEVTPEVQRLRDLETQWKELPKTATNKERESLRTELQAARKSTEIPVETVFSKPIEKKYSEESYLSPQVQIELDVSEISPSQETVKQGYVENQDPDYIPTVNKVGDKYVVNEGHHRIADQILKGAKTVRVKIAYDSKEEYEKAKSETKTSVSKKPLDTFQPPAEDPVVEQTQQERAQPAQAEGAVSATEQVKDNDFLKQAVYHASDRKRKGRLVHGKAPQFGTGVYFSTNKDRVQNEFGDEITEAKLNLSNPVYTSTKEWRAVEKLARQKAADDYNQKKNPTEPKSEGDMDFQEIDSQFISDAAKELGHDAIVQKDDGGQYDNEIMVLDESKIVYPEDAKTTEGTAKAEAAPQAAEPKKEVEPELQATVKQILSQRSEVTTEKSEPGKTAEPDYSKWKRQNVSYRGVKEKGKQENNRSGMLGKGLYTAPASNKSMTKEYGDRYFVVNARPKNPKVFNSLNEWEIWFQNQLVFPFSKAKGKEFPDIRDFESQTSIEKELQKRGFDGIEIKGREMVNFAPPDNVKYFKSEDEVKAYHNSLVENTTKPQQESLPIDPNRPSDEAINISRQYNDEVKNLTAIDPKDRAIASVIGKVNPGKYGDANALTSGMAKSYIRKTGTPIDVVAQQAGNNITPDDVWEFMQKYPQGAQSISTPAGNPKLRQLSDRYSELTGKAINRKIAKDIANKWVEQVGIEAVNEESSRLINDQNQLDVDKLIEEMEADPEGYMASHRISQEDFDYQLNALHYEKGKFGSQGSEVDRGDGQVDQLGQRPKSQGEPLSEQFGDTSKDLAETVREITALPLTHVPGLNMGKGLSAGTYASTEPQNRYGEGQKVTVSIKNPFVFKSENGIIPFRNQVLNDNIRQFNKEDFEDGQEFRKGATLEDLSTSGIDKLAEMVRKALQSEGYDSIYLPATETQEGELIVFDRENVSIGDQQTTQAEPTSQTPSSEETRGPPDVMVTVTDIDGKNTASAKEITAIGKRRLKALDLLKNCLTLS